MLSARAYSFRQKSRLAISLSWVAGYTNVTMFFLCGEVVSHMTGNTTHFGYSLARATTGGSGLEAVFFGFIILSFFVGAVASALMTEMADRRGVQSRYIAPIACEAVLLLCLAAGGMRYPHFGMDQPAIFFAMAGIGAFAMGLQNATITKISGAVIRTTHLTGVVTDLGLEGVQFLIWIGDTMRLRTWERFGRMIRISQRHPTAQRLALLASIFGSFLFGTLAGSYAFMKVPRGALLAPVAFLCWIVVVDWRKPIAAVKELDLLSDPELQSAGIVKALLPSELGIYRLAYHKKDASHYTPNFIQWAERLPHHWRVIILAFTPLTRLDANSMSDLRGALLRLRGEQRKLIIAGINPAQYKMLQSHGLIDEMGPENVCPDLEFAIAEAMSLLTGEKVTLKH